MILLTGATGYVGSRLLKALEADGLRVRCLVRRPMHPAAATTEMVHGDVFDEASLREALEGCDSAVYLIHSMASAGAYVEQDRKAAGNFAAAAREAGVRRIIYLGGLGSGPDLSSHLASRQEVGELLRESGIPVTEFRASIILGAGSLSFELVRALIDKLPVMVTPRWVRTPAQPISIDDVVAYLLEALNVDPPRAGVFEIGGADRVSYGELMQEYARQEGKRRLLVPVPMLTPALSARWLGLVTPLQARVGAAMIEGVRNATIVRDDSALKVFSVRPVGVAEAVGRAREARIPRGRALTGIRSAAALTSCAAACFAIAAIGGLAPKGDWYGLLDKPAWTPPSWAFGPIWTILYAMMAVAAWLVLRRDGYRESRLSLGTFGIMLLLNGAWSWIFFGLRAPGWAFAEVVVLAVVTGAAAVFFSARSTLAGLLMIPVLLWTIFAGTLNLAIWQMNR